MRGVDWGSTPIGPPATWPESLRTALRICLTSSFPMWIWWGPEYTMLYNDAHRPMLGKGKHPHWLGRSAKGCWAEIWNDLVPMLEAPEKRGEAAGFEDLLLILDRNDIKEETYFTFSISPILTGDGKVGGLICPTTETTRKVVSERRLRTLRDLGARAADTKSESKACITTAEVLRGNPHDVPFALIYRTELDGKRARLEGCVGLSPAGPDAPEWIPLEPSDANCPWALDEVVVGAVKHLREPRTRSPLPGGPWPEPCRDVLILPLGAKGEGRPSGFLIAGASPRRVFDQDYQSFFELIARHLSTALGSASAYQAERRRAEMLAELDRAKSDFFSNVSHEFRTPLTLMLGPLEDELSERRNPLPEARRVRLEAAHRNSLRLLKLVNSLLDFSRIEAGRMRATFEPTDLAAFTTDLAGVFRSAIEKAGLSYTVDCPRLPQPIHVDQEMWEKIVLNLLSNAFKHTFAGEISVRLRWRGDHAELAVEDTGVGIPQVEQPLLFERFHRVKGALSRSHEGSGIGLALVKELVELHGGSVRVESQEGKGSIFTVTVKAGSQHLPADRVGGKHPPTASPVHASAFVEEADRWLPYAGAGGHPSGTVGAGDPGKANKDRPSTVRILVAEDNADMRQYVTRILSPYWTVEAVWNGADAVHSALASPPDLVLSDVMMPVLGGFDLLKELRNHPKTRTVPVILLSARAGEEATVEGLGAGADDYLVKPFSARELVARVRAHLEMARLRRAAEISARELADTRAELLGDLERKNRDLEAYGNTLAHDLGAPLRAMSGFAQILKEDHSSALDEKGRMYVERVVRASERMSRMVKDLLAFTRVSREEFPMETVALGDVLKDSLDQLEMDLKSRNAVVNVVGEGLPAVRANRTLLCQVIANLVANASKFVARGTKPMIRIWADSVGGSVRLSIEDNGIGIDSKHHEKIFGVFQRLHSEAEYPGSGIGLAIVERGVDRMGGKVGLESEPGKGSRFWVELPGGPSVG